MRTNERAHPRVVGLAEAARQLGFSEGDATAAVRSGEFPVPVRRYTPTGRYRVLAEDIDEYLAELPDVRGRRRFPEIRG